MSDTQYIDKVGSFACVVKKPDDWLGEAGEKCTPYLRLPLIVTSEGDQKGRKITWFGYLSEKAFDNTIKSLAKAFPTWNGDIQDLVNGKFSFDGLPCEVVTESEVYQDKRRIKVKWLNSVGGGAGEGKGMAEDKVKALIAKMGSKGKAIAKAVRAESGAPAAKPTPKTPSPSTPDAEEPGDDNIPY